MMRVRREYEEGEEMIRGDKTRGRHHTAKSPHHPLPSYHHITHSPYPRALLPITTPLTVYTGMMSSGKMVKYLVVMLRGLSSIIWRLVHV